MTDFPWNYLAALLILLATNGAPIIAKKILGARFNAPLDGGRRFIDGRPLFGTAKTIRGVAAAIVVGALVAPIVGLDVMMGALAGMGAMAGDVLSSFLKRRMGIASSRQALGLDQIPESLIPLMLCRSVLGLDGIDIAALVAAFVVVELLVSRWLYRIHIRDQPY